LGEGLFDLQNAEGELMPCLARPALAAILSHQPTRLRHSRDRQRQIALRGTFPKECCFQVIYFVLNISFLAPDQMSPKASVATGCLTRAVKG
jgi:hypothetical protein